MFQIRFLIPVLMLAGTCITAQDLPVRAKKVFHPLSREFPAPAAYADSGKAAELLAKRGKILSALQIQRQKYLSTDPEARKLHEESAKLNQELSDFFVSKRRIREMENELLLLNRKIKGLEPAPETPEKGKVTAVFQAKYKTNLDPEQYADQERAAALFKLREELIEKMLKERVELLKNDPKAKSVMEKLMDANKKFAVMFMAQDEVMKLSRELRLLDAELLAMPRKNETGKK